METEQNKIIFYFENMKNEQKNTEYEIKKYINENKGKIKYWSLIPISTIKNNNEQFRLIENLIKKEYKLLIKNVEKSKIVIMTFNENLFNLNINLKQDNILITKTQKGFQFLQNIQDKYNSGILIIDIKILENNDLMNYMCEYFNELVKWGIIYCIYNTDNKKEYVDEKIEKEIKKKFKISEKWIILSGILPLNQKLYKFINNILIMPEYFKDINMKNYYEILD